MWDYDSLLAKTQVYLQRAEDHPHANDDEFALWMLLGLEFLYARRLPASIRAYLPRRRETASFTLPV